MENTKTPMKDKETKEWYKVEIRELIRKNLDKIHRKVGDSYGIDVSFLHKMISEYVDQELDKAREEGLREGLKQGYEKGRTQAQEEFAVWRRWR